VSDYHVTSIVALCAEHDDDYVCSCHPYPQFLSAHRVESGCLLCSLDDDTALMCPRCSCEFTVMQGHA
jgi:hypothetical protein